MRTKTIARFRRAALSGTLLAALAGQRAAAEEVTPRPENAPVVTEQSPRPPPDPSVKPVPGAPEQYTVQKGDTLWDLSQKFLSNPWYWPKIWSLNPGIENPHWIFPGNQLKIVPGEGGAQAPAQVQADGAASGQPQGEAAEGQGEPATQGASAEAQPGSPDLEVVNKNSAESRSANNSVSVSGKLAFTPPPVITVRASGLVTPEEMADAGNLDASFEEREMLSLYDTAYVRFKGDVPARPGDKLIIFRRDGEVTHPVSHKKLAEKTKTVGIAKILTVTGKTATVQIERTFEEIGRGDLVRLWTPQDKRIAPRPNSQEVKGGVIVSSVNGGLTTYGESNEVYIDRGSADGVQEGNTFAVVRHGDGLSNTLVTKAQTAGVQGDVSAKVVTPDENVGLLLVVDAREHFCTAVVVKSVRELQEGDQVEMRATGAGGGQ